MMRSLVIAAATLMCAACVVEPPPPPPPPPVAVPPPPPEAVNCREFTSPVVVGGQTVEAYGQACQQPDGTWKVTQNTPGVAQPQVFVVPPPPADYYVYPYPWWGTVSIGVGGAVFFGGGPGHGIWHGGWRGGRR